MNLIQRSERIKGSIHLVDFVNRLGAMSFVVGWKY